MNVRQNCEHVSKHPKNDMILTGRHLHPSNVSSDFVGRATVKVLTGECQFSQNPTDSLSKRVAWASGSRGNVGNDALHVIGLYGLGKISHFLQDWGQRP